ncbi:hypothetical protein HZY88_06730 [Aerococcaceae bacterium DSM 111176]|nr:hypothetical protein [Aerococcaceae bacterium DSM 111176]
MLEKLKVKITQFMEGRYGIDQLYMASIALYFVLALIQLYAQLPLVDLLLTAFFVWIFYRVLSKNLKARYAENEKFLAFTGKVMKRVNPVWQRIRDVRKYRYRKCPECGVTLRLPVKRGTHTTNCPKCKHRFEVKIRV